MAFMESILQMTGFQAVLFITHDLDLAICFANRVILMHDGQVVADGSPEEALSDPDLLRRCRLVPTSLLAANLGDLSATRRFMSAEALAYTRAIAQKGGAAGNLNN
jgi:energy-coupling factor transport system ATP-binding protein